MLSLSYSTEYKGKVLTLTLKRDPFWYGLGIYEDENGIKWDVHGCYGGKKPYIQARPVDGHVIYRTDAEACGADYSCEWLPYFVELEDPKLIKVKSAYVTEN